MSLELAIRHAKKNKIKPKGRTSISRFGALITDGYRFIYGWNSYKTHTLQARFAAKTGFPEKLHVHAEVAALAKAANSIDRPGFADMTLYVARVLADDSPACAKPCLGCLAAIAEFGIKHVEWTE